MYDLSHSPYILLLIFYMLVYWNRRKMKPFSASRGKLCSRARSVNSIANQKISAGAIWVDIIYISIILKDSQNFCAVPSLNDMSTDPNWISFDTSLNSEWDEECVICKAHTDLWRYARYHFKYIKCCRSKNLVCGYATSRQYVCTRSALSSAESSVLRKGRILEGAEEHLQVRGHSRGKTSYNVPRICVFWRPCIMTWVVS